MSEITPNPQDPNTSSDDKIHEYYTDVKKQEMASYETGIKKARNALFVTAALVLISELVGAKVGEIPMTPLFIAFILIESGIFVGLAFLTKTKPYSAIIIGLILFLLIWAASIYVNGTKGIYSGIIFKAVVIYFLVAALKPAKAWEEAKKTL